MRGIIYKYTSPSGKVYIGQTVNEYNRRCHFNNLNVSYGGDKIDNARYKYLPENFQYEILFSSEFETAELAKDTLDKLEIKYIDQYDSFRSGYNSTLGGGGTLGKPLTEEHKEKLRISCSGWHQTEEAKNKISESKKGHIVTEETRKKISDKQTNKRAIDVFDKDGNYLQTFDSINEASIKLNVDRRNIYSVLNGRNKTAKGYKFKINEIQLV